MEEYFVNSCFNDLDFRAQLKFDVVQKIAIFAKSKAVRALIISFAPHNVVIAVVVVVVVVVVGHVSKQSYLGKR